MFWGPGLLVGRHKFKELVEDTRFKYPDVWYQIDQMSMQDANHVWVAWTGRLWVVWIAGNAAARLPG